MAKQYDGWTIKAFMNSNPLLLAWHFHEKRTDVIKGFNEATGGLWRKYRRSGTHKIVKIKLVEVE